MAKIRVTLRDTQTGDEGVYEYDNEPDPDPAGEDPFHGDEYLWTDGNFGCDCNRLLFIARALGRPDRDVTCGDERVVIVDATIDGVKQDWK